MIDRPRLRQQIATALSRSRAAVLVGPRQSGKTTLARRFLPAGHANYFGQVWNAADPARSLGVSEPAVRRYLDHLT